MSLVVWHASDGGGQERHRGIKDKGLSVSLPLDLFMAPISYLSFLIFQEKCARELEIVKEEVQIARHLEMKKVPYTHTRPKSLLQP